MDQLRNIVYGMRQSVPEPLRGGFSVRLYVDKRVKMSSMDTLGLILGELGVLKVDYQVLPKKREYDDRYYLDMVHRDASGYFVFENSISKVSRPPAYIPENLMNIEWQDDGKVIVDEEALHISDLKNAFIEFHTEAKNAQILFTVDGDMSFGNYFPFLIRTMNCFLSSEKNMLKRNMRSHTPILLDGKETLSEGDFLTC